MNLGTVTTGLQPLTIGSVESFELDPILNALPWFIGGGTVTLFVADPNGNLTSFTATIDVAGFKASVNYTVIGPANLSNNGDPLDNAGQPMGPWRRAWLVVDSSGRTQKSHPIAFNVISSPV